ncbi:PREDICTED: protein SMG7L [Nelumbo nucifera]|uniref:Protein SMG7L n=1 Tax=Nelumbo nucifera TaxID=4432 RepID=A0A1U8B806_NELNU|nr:PREDICTED: protein SMG7L [Nelumbo nucifera]XP_010272417.1 PREDICTED: protein SMG7L [Nelumbo nucifera]XP_010272418.1 PREDICTED: protein SMG7L [Nelumbo nucifera]XP_010272419.1 PREDICTED: protein SMG7L [Nelumbo nucifera]
MTSMHVNATSPHNDENGTINLIVEAVDAEKQLWTSIHSKGLLHPDVRVLYHRVRSIYEKIILTDHELAELQDIEYSLWRVHYKHIDEYRNRILQSSVNAETINSVAPQNVAIEKHSSDKLMEGFRLFLSEATEFYQDLITKIKRSYGLPKELFYSNEGCSSSSVESTQICRCRFSCHRCLIYLGDLARYRELCGNQDDQKRDWSIAATHYLNASMIWPDSGNPHNQFAVLAIYVSDEFLALYHCVRSLAVKEPFPDAWNNLILLFEKNRSCNFNSLSKEVSFNFNKPYERIYAETKAHSRACLSTSNMQEAIEDVGCVETRLWSLIVRMISMFYLKSSLDDFSFTFTSTIRELEAILSFDDVRLKAVLESYQHMHAARTGPFRALQLVSILVFTIHTLSVSPKLQQLKQFKDMQQPVLIQLALTSTFICVGHLVDRCVMADPVDHCPLLPAILVFAELLVDILDISEKNEADERYENAVSYFFRAFVDLLNRLDHKGGEVESPDHTALWEDHELRGFAPATHCHAPLDFSTKERNGFEDGHECQIRFQRIFLAAMKVVNRSNGCQKLIFYDKIGRKFCTAEQMTVPQGRELEAADKSTLDVKVQDLQQYPPEFEKNNVASEEAEMLVNESNQNSADLLGSSAAVEEEEIILFNPLTRYNSAPLYIPEATTSLAPPSGECLHRGYSLHVAQSQPCIDSSSLNSNTTGSSCNKTFRYNDNFTGDSVTCPFSENGISAGPPSLSSWVLNRENLGTSEMKESSDTGKYGTGFTEDIVNASMTNLSISRIPVGQQDKKVTSPNSASHCTYDLLSERDSVIGPGYASSSTHYSPPPYSTPLPSAPLLPDDATWFIGDSYKYFERKDLGDIKHMPGLQNYSGVNTCSNWVGTQGPDSFYPGAPGFTNGYTPLRGKTDYAQWNRNFQGNLNLDRLDGNTWPTQFVSPSNLQMFHGHDVYRPNPYDRWMNPLLVNPVKYLEVPSLYPDFSLVYGTNEQRLDKVSCGYQPGAFGYGTAGAGDLRSEQQMLLQYLKTKEWCLQQESQLGGST